MDEKDEPEAQDVSPAHDCVSLSPSGPCSADCSPVASYPDTSKLTPGHATPHPCRKVAWPPRPVRHGNAQGLAPLIPPAPFSDFGDLESDGYDRFEP